MEFSCVWSKDAQQKKRKRWTDGVARFDPATGVLSVWNQDGSQKIFATRLKPDEASYILQEDGEETRVGGVSLQIMASFSKHPTDHDSSAQGNDCTQRRDPLGTLNTDGVRSPRKKAPTGRDVVAAQAARGGRKPSAGLGFKRRLGAPAGFRQSASSSRVTSITSRGSLSELSLMMDKGPEEGDSTASVGDAAEATDDAPTGLQISLTTGSCGGGGDGTGLGRTWTAFGSLSPTSLDAPHDDPADGTAAATVSEVHGACTRSQVGGKWGRGQGGGLGVGGARRFHAPRSNRQSIPDTSSDAASNTTDSCVPLLANRSLSNAADSGLVRRGLGSGGLGGKREGFPSSDGLGVCSLVYGHPPGAAVAPVAVDPEDLVLEWTNGNPPQPIRAGATLARRLHPHQREGLKVLWECLAGRGGYNGRGAILADEMGLGKTATAIALCTCILRHRKRECRKAVVVCPSSLVKNWANEFRKWCPLGGGAVAVQQSGAAAAQLVADFKIAAAARYPILIISYELYRNHAKAINGTDGLGLLIADEGHRLKNSYETKTTKALRACPAMMRLVLTGTPMQNDLDEFFAVADFVNPGLLGDLKSFRSRYTRPMKAAWDREADSQVSDLAAERTRELSELTLYKRCIANSSGARALLRGDGAERAAAGMRAVLPLISTLRRLCNHPDLVRGKGNARDECETETQELSEEHVAAAAEAEAEEDSDGDDVAFLLLDDDTVKTESRNDNGAPACAKGSMKHNGLASATAGAIGSAAGAFKIPRSVPGVAATAAAGLGLARAAGKRTSSARMLVSGDDVETGYETQASGKLLVLEALLRAIRRVCPSDKVVICSNFTSALDVLGRLAGRNGWDFLCLDGGTASDQRQSLVDRFNKALPDELFLFFLSAKAGGVGLNLVGANRIVLFDSDWNPATDDQAMARVWRLGQKRTVSMYRLITTGTLEESIYQRQIFKGALYDLIRDSNQPSSSASSQSPPKSHTDHLDDGRYGACQKAAEVVTDRSQTESDGGGSAGGAQSNRGFSKEELRELFLLKMETQCDTFDKLRRGQYRTADKRRNDDDDGMPVLMGDESGQQDFEIENPSRYSDRNGIGMCSTDKKGNSGEQAAERVASTGSRWQEYKGPKNIVDRALRMALEKETERDIPVEVCHAGISSCVVSDVVTFVHEVKRGCPL